MKMKTFQADTMQEALNLVKDEMGPDAVILKSRRANRRVNGRMQGCFEVTAALEEPLTNRKAVESARPVPMTADRQAPSPARSGELRQQLRSDEPRTGAPRTGMRPLAGRIPPIEQYDWRGSLTRVPEEMPAQAATPASAIQAARRTAAGMNEKAAESQHARSVELRQQLRSDEPRSDRRTTPISAPPAGSERRAPVPAAGPDRAALEAEADNRLIEILRSELKVVQEKAEAPARELKGLKDEIRAMMDSAAARMAAAQAAGLSHATPVPGALAGLRSGEFRGNGRSAMSPATAWISNPEFQGLQEGLIELEMDPALAAEAVGAAYAAYRNATMPEALANMPAGDREAEFISRSLAERIRVSGGIRLRPGRPTTVALVGPTGVGKTTTLAKLAALAKIQQGKKVGIISADSFRMGANEQLEIFGRTAGIPVRAVFSPEDVAKAQREFAECDLILVDTAGRSHGHKEMWRELQGLLHCLAPDEVHMVLAGPTRMRELWHQYSLYRELGATSLIFTKLDECLSLGCLFNLARRAEAPLAYLCNGQVIPDHILLARPDLLAGALAEAARAALGGAHASMATAQA